MVIADLVSQFAIIISKLVYGISSYSLRHFGWS